MTGFPPRQAYLVKWAGLSYTDSTWEWKEAIDDDLKLALFHRINLVPSGSKQSAQFVEEPPPPTEARPPQLLSLRQHVDVRRKVDSALYLRANQVCKQVVVAPSIRNYVGQAEASGLLQLGDEIVCINGRRVEGQMISFIMHDLNQNASHRVIRFLRRSTGHQAEIRFDPSVPLGLLLGNPEYVPSYVIQPCAYIRMFLTPLTYESIGIGMSETDILNADGNVTPSVRAGVIRVFQLRSPRLTLELAAKEARVPLEWLKQWFSKTVMCKDENEVMLVNWIKRCAMAFRSPSYSSLEAVEASLLEKVRFFLFSLVRKR